MEPFSATDFHKRLLQIGQQASCLVMLVSGAADTRPFHKFLRLHIQFAQAVDHDMDMDVAAAVVAVRVGAYNRLVPGEIFLCVLHPDDLCAF